MNTLATLPTHKTRYTSGTTAIKQRLSESRHDDNSRFIKKSISEMIALRNTNKIDDETFTEVMELFVTRFVENEVNYHLGDRLESQLGKLGFLLTRHSF